MAGASVASGCGLLHFQLAFALDRVKALEEARTLGWTIASMKSDWRTIYPAKKP